jgi:peroxiredoxin
VSRLPLGAQAPDFTLPGVDGADHSPADWEGRPVAVVFSCCHCPYVVAWEDRLNTIARDYEGRAGLIAVNSNGDHLGDGPDDMRARAQEKAFVFPFVRDESQEVARAYGAARTPEVFLLDAQRRLAYQGAPDSDYTDEAGAEPWLRRALDALLAGEAPDPAETPAVGCSVKWAG